MNMPIKHLINSRVLTTYYPIDKELNLNNEKNYLFDLSHLHIVTVEGEKAREFLQGQLSCDINLISDIQMVQGAQCNLKGRILALMDIVNWDGIKLVLPSDLIESTVNSLAKTAQLSRVSLNESNQLVLFGLYLQNPKDIIPNSIYFPTANYAQSHTEHYCYYHLGNGFYIFIVKKEYESDFRHSFVEQEQLLGSLTWHSLRLKNKQLQIYPESRGIFLPHRLDLHTTPIISFNKGCYKGQEIIARTHYRATLKHELKHFVIKTNEKIFSGQKLLRGDTEYGELVDYSILNENTYLIAASVLKESAQTVLFEGNQQQTELITT